MIKNSFFHTKKSNFQMNHFCHITKNKRGNIINIRGDKVETEKRYADEKEVAKIIGCSVQTLRNDRNLGRGFPYSKKREECS